MKIIQATTEHLDFITPLFNDYRKFYNQEPDLNLVRSFIEERIKNNQSVIFLAMVNEKGAGFTQLYPSFSSVAMKKIWILNDLYVSPQYRRQNIAGGLINKAVELGKQSGAARITLETDIDNYQAQALYDKTGFRKIGHCYFYQLDL
jgi:ribosomal protein S18 acetylase RimI-like enzyme